MIAKKTVSNIYLMCSAFHAYNKFVYVITLYSEFVLSFKVTWMIFLLSKKEKKKKKNKPG